MESSNGVDRQPSDRQQNKTLVRGLTVLSAVEALGRARLTTIANETGLPKPTVSRLLQTLREQGYVRELGLRQGYVSTRAPICRQATPKLDDLLHIAKPVLDGLIDVIKFPTALAIVADSQVSFILDNSDKVPINLANETRRQSVSLTRSAAGLAYLAALPEQERHAQLRVYRDIIDDVSAACTTTSERGYALSSHDDVAPGLKAVAVSLCQSDRPIGSLTTHFVDDYVTEEKVSSQFYPKLRQASVIISEQFSDP